MADREARARGYDQVLWLLNGLVTEAGASNFFIVWTTRGRKVQLVTAPLGDKIILDGVTRRSILQLSHERLTDGKTGLAPLDVVERQFTMEDIVEAVDQGRIVEAFAAGTAYFVCPVSVINYRERDLEIPMARGDSGDYAALLKGWLEKIMYGRDDHKWGVVVEEKEEF
jgi:branched-chain amino acid aminotransferase